MSKKQFIHIHPKPKYKDVEEIDIFSADEKEFLEVLNPLKETSGGNLHYHPEAFSDYDNKEDVFSYLKCDLGEDFKIRIYFRNGVYESWIFENKTVHDRSSDKDKHKKEKAKEKITYILEQYAVYEEARYNISKYIDNVYF